VRARTITLKLKLARPLGGGRYPMLTRSFSLEHATDDGPEISRIATSLLARVGDPDKIRLAGVQVHQLERPDLTQLGLFEGAPARPEVKRDRLNRALDKVTKKFGEEAVTRGLARAERAAPSRRIK
jgi:hypothetical protein